MKKVLSPEAGIAGAINTQPAPEQPNTVTHTQSGTSSPDSTDDKQLVALEAIARVCHEANRAWCAANGDFSQKPWEEAPEWQRSSAVKGVEFNMANPDAPASASHDSWLDVKKAEGWKYGPVKNADTKEHPCFVPYEQLPLADQKKDHLFKAIVNALK